MSKKLAITSSGTVSLGSYEARVLCDVLEAVCQHNNDPATIADNRIVIDVLTGASAGPSCSRRSFCIARVNFKGLYNNPLYNLWVKRISLARLQATEDNEPALTPCFRQI
jgi:hypothetical protein